MSKHVVATVSEIPPGQRKLVTVRGRSIAVFNLDGEYFGLFNRCPHQGGPIGEGQIEGATVTCPWHAWTFDLRTGGMALGADFARLRRFDARVRDGRIEVATEPEEL